MLKHHRALPSETCGVRSSARADFHVVRVCACVVPKDVGAWPQSRIHGIVLKKHFEKAQSSSFSFSVNCRFPKGLRA